MKRTKIYCDGASNSFGSVFCVVLRKVGGELVHHLHTFDKRISPIEAEYLSVICSLELAVIDCTVFTDNKTVYSCITGKSKTEKYLSLVNKAMGLIKKNNVHLIWISRNKNLAGIYLEKRLNALHETWKENKKLPKKKFKYK